MPNSSAGIFELSLVFGGLLAFLFWELWSIRRTLRRDEQKRQYGDRSNPSSNENGAD